jgi:hypothetical protein
VTRGEEVAGVSEDRFDGRRAGRWAAAVGAVLLAGGGFVAAGGSAYAGGEPDDNVGAPGENGQDVTCTAYAPPMNVIFCNSVGEDGADGRSSTVHR